MTSVNRSNEQFESSIELGELKPPIFLLGNVRSGTTMLHRIFDLHDDIQSWFEPRTIWVYGAPKRRHDLFTAEDASEKVKRYIRKRFLKHQRKHGDRRIMEKTPSNILRIPYVDAIFPEAKYLYVIREPLANLSSAELRWQYRSNWHRLWERFLECPKTQIPYHVSRIFVDRYRKYILRKKYFSIWGVRYPEIYNDLKRMSVEEIVSMQWAFCSKQAEQDIAHIDPSRIMRIRYEDFVLNPVDEYRKIANHFEISLNEQIEKQVNEMVDPSRQNKWKRLDIEVLQKCYPIVKDEMARHGYDSSEMQRLLSST